MGVSINDVKYVSQLARLDFDENKLQKFTNDINQILDHMNKLNELNTDNVDISVNPVPLSNAFREDEIKDSLNRDELLKNAPDSQYGYFKVPRIIEG